ncbi:MAG: hypothetical protein ACPGU5_08040 [Lishizhenia sp.]
MKKLKINFKLGLSMLIISGLVYFFNFAYPVMVLQYFGSWETLDAINTVLLLFYALSIGILFFRISKHNLAKDEKTLWIVLSIVFPVIIPLLIVWKKDKEWLRSN